jgi:hypothetical protein
MIEVTQTTFGNGDDPDDLREPGNCFAACLASIFELSLKDLPKDLNDSNKIWWDEVTKWCTTTFDYIPVYLDASTDYDFNGLCIAIGKSPRDVRHAVIYDKGRMIFDPHPSRGGIEEPVAYVVFVDKKVGPRYGI